MTNLTNLQINMDKSYQGLACNSSLNTVTRCTRSINIGLATVNLRADIEISNIDSRNHIIDCRSWTDITGFTFCYTWTQTYNYHIIEKNGSSITVRGGGLLDWHIGMDGGIKVFSEDIDLELSFTVPFNIGYLNL